MAGDHAWRGSGCSWDCRSASPLGRFAWNLFAEDLGVVPEPVVPAGSTLLIVPATLLLATLIAAIPGRMAARTQPALALRAE